MTITKSARIGSLAGGLDLDESDQGVAQGDCIIRTRLERGDRRLADCLYGTVRETTKLGQIGAQSFERRAKLIFRFASNGDVLEFRFGLSAEATNGSMQCKCDTGLLSPKGIAEVQTQ